MAINGTFQPTLIGPLATRDFIHAITLRYCSTNSLYLDVIYVSFKINSGKKSIWWIQMADWSHTWKLSHRPAGCPSTFHHPCTGVFSVGESYSRLWRMGVYRCPLEAIDPLAGDFGGKEDTYIYMYIYKFQKIKAGKGILWVSTSVGHCKW